ncbi:trefoil factor 3 [Alligator mississippiensis]|nr:trefoil factor 3 [Alligator mississippiensis]
MEPKGLWLLAILLVFGLTTLIDGVEPPTKCQCAEKPNKRRECGYPGIKAEECHKRGCCFDASVTGVRWCFKPFSKLATGECSMNVYDRKECGFLIFSEKCCLKRGCCFDSSYPGVKRCFHPNIKNDC